MPPDGVEAVVGLTTEIRVSLRTGDLTVRAGDSRDRLLLAGLGPLRRAVRSDARTVLLETATGEHWLVRVSAASGLVTMVEPVTAARPEPHGVAGARG